MRVRIRRYARAGAPPRPENAPEPAEPIEEEVDVPATPFVTVSGITALLTTLGTLATSWFVTKPDAEQKRELDMLRYRTEVLERALQVESADGRRTSLALLLAFGLLEPGDASRIPASFRLQAKDSLPRWRIREDDRKENDGGAAAEKADSASAEDEK